MSTIPENVPLDQTTVFPKPSHLVRRRRWIRGRINPERSRERALALVLFVDHLARVAGDAAGKAIASGRHGFPGSPEPTTRPSGRASKRDTPLPAPLPSSPWMTPPRASRQTGISAKTILSLIRIGRITPRLRNTSNRPKQRKYLVNIDEVVAVTRQADDVSALSASPSEVSVAAATIDMEERTARLRAKAMRGSNDG